MSPDQDSPFDVSDQGNAPDPLDALDSSLLNNIQGDARLNSGVPGGQRVSDLDFIQMAGLTRNVPSESDTALGQGDMDPNRPVSFFEAGVADVDASMAPKTPFDLGSIPDDDIIPNFAPSAPSPAVSRPAAPTIMASAPIALQDEDDDDLLRAERLLQALEAQPREFQDSPPASLPHVESVFRNDDPPAPVVRPSYLDRPVEPPIVDDYEDQPEGDMSVYGKPIPPKNMRRAKRAGAHIRRKLIRLGLVLVILCLIGAAGVVGYRWMALRLAAPEELLSQASKLPRDQRFDEAAQCYLNFASLHEGHPGRPEAQFEAAFALLSAPDQSFDETKARRVRALGILKDFVEQNPAHVKVPRARILMGIHNFKLGNNEEAINLLRDQNLQMSDTLSVLPVLRTLGQAYALTGSYDDAESAYLQAVSLEENPAPDSDYNQLGDLFKKRGEATQVEAERVAYYKKALDYWQQSVRMPGINPVDKGQIKEKLDWLRGQLGIDAPVEEPTSKEGGSSKHEAAKSPSAPEAAKPDQPVSAPLVADPGVKEINPALEAPKAAAPVAETPAPAPAPAPEPSGGAEKAAEHH
jgi:tetratricopeptide (TPR) repeat protein